MAENAFSFLRATYYRWMLLWPVRCAELADAPTVLSVGDLHVENYGTWRDAEGRLVWGINDFDEAYPLPYTNDLVRLAASACLAIQLNELSLTPAQACAAMLAGYTAGLEAGGKPFVLSERNRWLRMAVTSVERDPVRWWKKLNALPTTKGVPPKVMAILKQAMPETGLDFRVAHRTSGLGSLGRERFVAIAEWRGGKIAREAKALLPSACVWASGRPEATVIHYPEIVRRAVRVADPFLRVHDGWIVRRLSPYCSRIELSHLPRGHDEEKLLRAMGRELANVHSGASGDVSPIQRDLERRKRKWLSRAAETMVTATMKDWKEWRKWMRQNSGRSKP
jgi:hypothetical protein